ncbi:MAG: hypothetical protein AAGU12_12020 [Clostridiales bacterium]
MGPQGSAGPTGAQGPVGPQGLTGVTGATGPEISSTLIDTIWVGGALSSLANGAAVPFDNIRTDRGNISYNQGTREFIINETGYYLVNWWIATGGIPAPSTINFALRLNGVTQSQSASPLGTGQVSGTAVVRVAQAPSTLTLVNDSGAAISIPATAAQGDITIVKVASLP